MRQCLSICSNIKAFISSKEISKAPLPHKKVQAVVKIKFMWFQRHIIRQALNYRMKKDSVYSYYDIKSRNIPQKCNIPQDNTRPLYPWDRTNGTL